MRSIKFAVTASEPDRLRRFLAQAEQDLAVAKILGRMTRTRLVAGASQFVQREVAAILAEVRSANQTGAASPSEREDSAEAGPGDAGPDPSVLSDILPGYHLLAAQQILPRLDALSPEELEAVAAFEEATRGRRTVLARIEQLRRSG
jgi:hypothetical protein